MFLRKLRLDAAMRSGYKHRDWLRTNASAFILDFLCDAGHPSGAWPTCQNACLILASIVRTPWAPSKKLW
jgi:hypothetical protein